MKVVEGTLLAVVAAAMRIDGRIDFETKLKAVLEIITFFWHRPISLHSSAPSSQIHTRYHRGTWNVFMSSIM
jgi:hypothetical protein